jgi:hypothetical protein
MTSKECEHQWTLDDASAQHDSETQLWYGCSECFATRYVVVNMSNVLVMKDQTMLVIVQKDKTTHENPEK